MIVANAPSFVRYAAPKNRDDRVLRSFALRDFRLAKRMMPHGIERGITASLRRITNVGACGLNALAYNVHDRGAGSMSTSFLLRMT
jgi:hypothetical protein